VSRSRCPEALYGQHGEANSRGKCPYCGDKITAARSYTPSRGTRSITHEEEDFLDTRQRERDTWGGRIIPADQDPEVDPDPDDYLYD
jgi:hypothetical protein